MNTLLSPTGEFPAFNPSARQILPAAMAVSVAPLAPSQHASRRRFNDTDWKRSALRRELRDVPNFTESIELASDHAVTRFIDHATKRETSRRVVQFAFSPEPALTIAEEPKPFERVPTLQSEAAAALSAINERKPSARRSHRLPRPALKAPRTASPVWLAAVIVLGALTAAVLLSRVLL
jgi:hypothetical protein